MIGGLAGAPVFIILVACTKRFKPVLMFLILLNLTGLGIFNYAIYQSKERGDILITAAMYIIGCGSFSFYGIAFEFLVSITNRNGESLTCGCVNFYTCVLAMFFYYLSSLENGDV
jgi:hypothetical protein